MAIDYAKYLRASNGDGEPVRANVVAEREVGSMEINVDTLLNWPPQFIATSGVLDSNTGTFDPTTVCVFYGHSEGSYIKIDEFAPGYTDNGHEANEIVVLKPTTPWADQIAETAEGGGLPSGGTTGEALIKKSDADGDVEWGSGGGVSIISKETPAGDVNGGNVNFTTNLPYVGGSLQVYVNGLAQSQFVNEANPSTGLFTLDVAPKSGDHLSVSYQFASSETGNSNSIGGYTIQGLLEAIYPIGAPFYSDSDTMPALIASIGTWQKLENVFILAASSSYPVGSTGGAATHTLTEAQLPNVSGSITNIAMQSTGSPLGASGAFSLGSSQNGAVGSGVSGVRDGVSFSFGSGQAHNNMPPYKAKHAWERIA